MDLLRFYKRGGRQCPVLLMAIAVIIVGTSPCAQAAWDDAKGMALDKAEVLSVTSISEGKHSFPGVSGEIALPAHGLIKGAAKPTVDSLILFEIWRFISPALYPSERRGVRKALAVGSGMFFLGVLWGYSRVYPLTLRFLSTYTLSTAIENQISLNSYIDNFMMLILCMGLAFELPLVTWLLSLLGIVNKAFLRKYRRHAAVLIVVLAAVITPTGDPFTLTAVGLPLYLLYELSILMIKDKKTEED